MQNSQSSLGTRYLPQTSMIKTIHIIVDNCADAHREFMPALRRHGCGMVLQRERGAADVGRVERFLRHARYDRTFWGRWHRGHQGDAVLPACPPTTASALKAKVQLETSSQALHLDAELSIMCIPAVTK